MKTIEDMIEVMEHFKNGGEVEYLNFSGFWAKGIIFSWDWLRTDYRIKPKEKKMVKKYKWLILYAADKEEEDSLHYFKDEEEAKLSLDPDYAIIKRLDYTMQEIEDES